MMPKPEEFLNPDNGYLKKEAIEGIYKEIKRLFIEIANSIDKYDYIILDGASRTGRSYLINLLAIYMSHNGSYSNIDTVITWVSPTVSNKFNQLWSVPLTNMTNNPPVLHNVISTNLIGFQPAMVIFTDIRFVCERYNDIDIQQYIDLINLAHGQLKETTNGPIIISGDPSIPELNTFINKLKNKDRVFYKHLARWDVSQETRCPVYNKTGETFKVFTGKGPIGSFIVNDQFKFISNQHPECVIEIPIDFKKTFELNILKSLNDIAGIPTYTD